MEDPKNPPTGAGLKPTSAPAHRANPDNPDSPLQPPAPTPAPIPEEVAKDWKKVAIIASTSIPSEGLGGRKIIFAQTRDRLEAKGPVIVDGEEVTAAEGTHRNGAQPGLKQVHYPKGADAYMRLGFEADFGDVGDAQILTVGFDLSQGGTEGLSERPGIVNVGPASPVYAAVDWAITHKGATDVRVFGLDDDEAATLKPWFAKIPDDRAKVTIA